MSSPFTERFGDAAVDPVGDPTELEALIEDQRKRREEREANRPDYSNRTTGEAIVNELVKSYGFRQNARGQWGWSLDNIAQSFEEDPVWSTIDWLTLAMPAAKWGTGAARVSLGQAGSISKAFGAGEFAGKKATSKMGRFMGSVLGHERTAAAEMYLKGGGRTFRFLKNPVTHQFGDDYLQVMAKYGAEPWEGRGLAKAMERESALAQGAFSRMSTDLQKTWERAGLSTEQRASAMKFLQSGSEATPLGASEGVIRETLGGRRGWEAYKATWDFRNHMHEKAFELGLIDEGTYKANLFKYSPRQYQEYIDILKGMPGGAGRGLSGGKGAAGSFAHRGPKSQVLEEVLDPAVALDKLGEIGQLVARQEFAQNITSSVIARSADEVAALSDLVRADSKLAKLHGVNRKTVESINALEQQLRRTDSWNADTIAEALGWRRLDQLFTERGMAIPGYLERLPDNLKNKWIDPAVANDLVGMTQWLDKPGRYTKMYRDFLGIFKATKTAYNPATHTRNWFGAMVMHHLSTGGTPTFFPTDGMRAIKAGMKDQDFLDGVRAGIVGSSWDNQLKSIHRGFTATGEVAGKGKATALEPLTDHLGSAGNIIEKLAGHAEHGYRFTDEVWKLDAFIKHKKKLAKVGLEGDELLSRSALEVNKFMAGFSSTSEFGKMANDAIPFASFTTEALRIWKNAMSEKPHIAYFWNHVAESMSQSFGAMAGYSVEELRAAKDSLPDYMQNKKMLMLPFNVDSKPMFLDLSYLIPLANISDVAQSDTMFFDELFNPATSPAVGIAAAIATGKDPFSGRDIEPEFLERQLGIAGPSSPGARKMVGLAEYSLRLMLPPLVPPGYAGVNLLEYARGQRHPMTGELLEEGVVRTLAGNLAGMRGYSATTEAQILNVRREGREATHEISQAWRRYSFGLANGDVTAMDRERRRIVSLKAASGADDPIDYFRKGALRRQPGEFSQLSSRQIKEILARSERAGAASPRDARMRAALMNRLQSRRKD